MVDFDYLYKGLCGLANSHKANALAGHLGAALVAGYFIGEEHPDLDDGVYRGIEKELDRIVLGEEKWFDPKKAGVTVPELFKPFPEEQPRKDQISTLAKSLSRNINKTRQSGHNVIFASLAIRALHDHPDYATPSILAGIRKLIDGFNGAVPGRGYYGKERGWVVGDKVQLPEKGKIPPYADRQVMAETVIDTLIRFASGHRRGFGGLFHLINHTAGLIELSNFGYQSLAKKGFAAHWNHLRLWNSLPDLEEELGPVKASKEDPRTPQYWASEMLKRDSARLTHRIKTIYGFFTLTGLIENPEKRKQAEKKFLYLMA